MSQWTFHLRNGYSFVDEQLLVVVVAEFVFVPLHIIVVAVVGLSVAVDAVVVVAPNGILVAVVVAVVDTAGVFFVLLGVVLKSSVQNTSLPVTDLNLAACSYQSMDLLLPIYMAQELFGGQV